MKKVYLLIALAVGSFSQTFAQYKGVEVVKVAEARQPSAVERILIPDVNGYKALKCDFHTHTIFSDGSVLPQDRVNEAVARGLDVIAITDHIEYRPHKTFVVGDLNESYRKAKAAESGKEILVVQGTEITRGKPLGHLNALFVSDANVMNVEDPLVAIDKAMEQGAFIMWNHPGWPNDTSTIYKVHQDLIKQKKIHGIEVVNHYEFYPVSFNYCKDYNLTYMGNTDIHGVYNQTFRTDKQYGPMTIVFARDRSVEGVKEALFAHRSVVKFGDLLIGSKDNLTALALACLPYTVKSMNGNEVLVEVANKSSLNFDLQVGNKIISIPGNEKTELKVQMNDKIRFVNTQITDSSQLEIEVASLM